MKKALLLWLVVCLLIILTPKIVDRLTPKTVFKEVPIWKIREVVKEVEKPVFEGEKIVEKIIKVVEYKESQVDIFRIKKLDEDTYTIAINDEMFPQSIWDISTGANSKGLVLQRQRRQDNKVVKENLTSVTPSTVGWYN